MSNRTELIKLLCMSDQELIEYFQKNLNIPYLSYEFQYNWRKRMSIYTKTNITLHEYRWLVDALRCHSHDELLLLREEIESLLKMEGDMDDKNTNNIKKAQSCPSFLNSSYTSYTINDALEKTVNGC